MAIWTGFLLGLVGSLHCIGMCGPIALALPWGPVGRLEAFSGALAYNLGRLSTYAFLGALIGWFGQGLVFFGVQTYFALGVGVLLLLTVLFSLNLESRLGQLRGWRRLQQRITGAIGQLFQRPGLGPKYLIGALNGLLPCGLVYTAIAGAMMSGKPLQGAGYLVAFGLGTLPLMLATTVLGQFVPSTWRAQLRRWTPALLLAMGLLFLFRGLGVAPPDTFRFWEIGQQTPNCH